jgi:hypothetical protein
MFQWERRGLEEEAPFGCINREGKGTYFNNDIVYVLHHKWRLRICAMLSRLYGELLPVQSFTAPLQHLDIIDVWTNSTISPIYRYQTEDTRAVCKVRGLTLLLRVGTLWRCGDGLIFEIPPWQAMHFLQCSTHFSKTCCRPLMTSKFLISELTFHGWKSPEIAWSEI